MSAKSDFANTINEIGSFGVIGASECHNYGSTWGCDSGCPVLMRGDCKIIGEVIDSVYNGKPVIDDEDDYLYLKELYKI